MLDRLRELFRSSPHVITVRRGFDGGWVAEWRGGKYRNEPTCADFEAEADALDFAHRKRSRLMTDGERATVEVDETPPPEIPEDVTFTDALTDDGPIERR